MLEFFDVFISYKHEDQAFAEVLRERLIAWGYTAWMDKYNIPAGAYWPDEINRGLNASKVVIGVLSPCAVESRNVKNEWDWSIVNGKRLLLLLIEPCAVPMNYISINYIDCVKDHAAGLARLQAALTRPAAPPPPVDPYLDYLQALYDRINTYLAQTIIKVRPNDSHTPEPIQLRSERTRGAVDALFEKRDEIDPLFMIGGIKQEQVKLDGDFRTAFDYFDGRVLLLGEAGTGKTITLLHFGRDAVVQRIQDPTRPLPILAIIPTWDVKKQAPLTEWLVNSYGTPLDVDQIVTEGRALLLLDGLDELDSRHYEPSPNNPDKLIFYDPRQRFMGMIPFNNQIIVTCRVKDYEEIGEKISLNGAVTLQKLTDSQIRDYLSVEVTDLWAALEADEELLNMARTPLLLSLLAFAYRDQDKEARKLRDLRGSPGQLRDAIFERYVTRRYEHEMRKLSQRQLLKTLPFTLDEIYEVLGRAATKTRKNVLEPRHFDLSNERLLFFLELAVRLHLLTFGDGNTFRFIHSLLQGHFGFLHALVELGSKNGAVRESAIHFLAMMSDPRAVEPLVQVLNDMYGMNSHYAADALARIGEAAVPPLIAILQGIKSGNEYFAARILGEIGDVRAVAPLVNALYIRDLVTPGTAAKALVQIGEPAVELLIMTLRSVDKTVRVKATDALGQIKDARAVEPLIVALHDTDPWMCERASIALGQIRDPRAVEPLIAILSDNNIQVCRQAAIALGEIGDARAVKPLIAALHNPDNWLRYYAAQALGQIGDVNAVEPLTELLADTTVVEYWPPECTEGDTKRVCDAAAAALISIGGPAVDPLIVALGNAEPQVCEIAAKALGRIGDIRAVDPLIASLRHIDEQVRRSTVKALGRISDSRAVESLSLALHDSDFFVRTNAANALGQIKDARAVEPLIAALHDKSWRVCISAAEALGQIGDMRGVKALIPFLSQKGVVGEKRICDLAAEALYRIVDIRAVDSLIAILCHSDQYVRGSAAKALGIIGDNRAIEPIMQLLSDTAEIYFDDDHIVRVCDTAAYALEQIGTYEAHAAVEVWQREQNQE